MLTETVVAENEAVQVQVERILHSEDLRGSEVLRRLLRFLAEKTATGEADELKEYIVAIDGLGKPPTYDPRHNSAVRIQVGRLRQKLADYYRGEGRFDPIIIDLPKGRFKLKFEYRNSPVPSDQASEEDPEVMPSVEPAETRVSPSGWRKTLVGFSIAASLCALAVAILVYAGYRWGATSHANAAAVSYPPGWNEEMEALWKPFVSTGRPLIVAIEDPLFVELNGSTGIYYRDRTLNNWN